MVEISTKPEYTEAELNKLYKFYKKYFVGNPSSYILSVFDKKKEIWSWKRKFSRLTKETIIKHLNHEIAIGSYPIYNKHYTYYCRFVAIDIDFHKDNKAKGTFGINKTKKKAALDKIEFILTKAESYFRMPAESLLLEESGGGYHIWVILKPDTTLKNASLYIDLIMPRLQELFNDVDKNLEVFPKQSYGKMKALEAEGFNLEQKPGNAIRLPLGFNFKRNHPSQLLVGELNKIQPVNIKEITKDVKLKISKLAAYRTSNIKVDLTDRRKIKLDEPLTYFYDHPDFRPCFKAILDNRFKRLEGSSGHLMRLCLVNELYHYGAKKEVIIQAFANLKDFDYDITKGYVEEAISSINAKGTSMRAMCKSIKDWGFCLDVCSRNGKRTKDVKEREKFPSLNGWDEVRDAIDEKVKFAPEGRYFIYKTTRSGTTTVVIERSLKYKKKLLMIAPLIGIFEKTVKDAINIGRDLGHLEDKPYKIHRVKSNFETCAVIKNKYGDLDDIQKVFPFFFRGFCNKCKKDVKKACAYQKFLINLESRDLIYLTVRKFNAMIKGSEESQQVLQRLLNWADVIFIDECSSIFDVEWDSMDIFYTNENNVVNRTEDWENALNKFCAKYPKWIAKPQIIELVKFITIIKEKIEEYRKMNVAQFKAFKNVLADKLDSKQMVSFYLKMIQYYKTTQDADIHHLVECFLNMGRKKIYIQLILPLGREKKIIFASVNDVNTTVDYLEQKTKNKLLFLTDATKPLVNLDKCFSDLDYIYVNDPMDTASKQKIYVLPNTKSFYVLRDELAEDIITVLDMHAQNPHYPVFLISQSIKVQNFLIGLALRRGIKLRDEWRIDKMDYFRGRSTRGQPSVLRKMLVFGSPEPPKHCYDYIANIYRKAGHLEQFKSDEVAGEYLRNGSAAAEFFQAISRVKDPMGEDYSTVIVYGMRYIEVKNYLDLEINTPQIYT